MFIHVPAAWLGMMAWGLMSLAALGTLVWRHPLADVAAKTAAPIGAAFTLLCLVTGSLWGRPMWGTYWVWDARLTSELVLFLMYLGVIALWRTIDDPGRAARAAAVLTLVGALDLPIIKFSVDWWNTLHQPASVFRVGGSTIDPSPADPAVRHGDRLHAAVLHPASGRHAQRDHAAARAHAADHAGRSGGRTLTWIAWISGPHAAFIVIAYGFAALIVAAMIAWIVVDHRRQTRSARRARGARRDAPVGTRRELPGESMPRT